MRLLVYAATPLVAGAAVWGWRALQGRAPKRYAVNAIIGVTLLVYFAITASLGLFWVARQELPVFDPHYLFGYMTIALVAAHVSVNARQLVKFARQQSPRALVQPETGEWRWPLRALGWVALASALVGGGFYWGMAHASLTVVTSEGARAPLPTTGARIPTSLPSPLPVPDESVTAGKASSSLALFYHQQTVASQDGAVDWSQRPEPFKTIPGATIVPLPRDHARGKMSTEEAIAQTRRPLLGLSPKAVSLASLSSILQMTDGLTGTPHSKLKGLAPIYPRAAASAGGLYSTHTYVVAHNVEGLEPGIYHYEVKGQALERVTEGHGLLPELSRASSSPSLVREASFALLFTTEYFRTSFKYGVRSYRFELLDAGHMAENAILAGAYEGLASVPLGRFDDAKVNALLRLDPSREAALLILPFGARDDAADADGAEWSFTAAPADVHSASVPTLITLMQGHTMLQVSASRVGPFPLPAPLEIRTGEGTTALPAPAPGHDDLFATIDKRRSARHWGPNGMTSAQLSTVLETSLATDAGRDPSVGESRAVRQYVVVMRVQGVANGVYAYDSSSNALHLLKAGDESKAVYNASLLQDCAGEADAVVVHTADIARLSYPDGARGYRYAGFDAGMAGERLYLSTVALGLGATGVGSFEDDEMGTLLGTSNHDELVLYLSAIGAVPPKDDD